MRTIEVTFHLPGIILEETERFTLGSGHVQALSFAKWQQLDQSFQFAEKKYNKSRPVFWTGIFVLEETASQDDMNNIINDISNKVHTAFLLESKLPWLPTPALSVMYCRVLLTANERMQGLNALVPRLIGAMEREWIVYGPDVKIPYNAQAIDHVDRVFKWMEKYHPLNQYKTAATGLSVMERTARPDSWWGDAYKHSINDFLHCIAACENLLLPPNYDNKTDLFGKYAAIIMAATYAKRKPIAKQWSQVYQLRHNLMHGRVGLNSLDEHEKHLLPMPRYLLREIIMTVLLLELDDSGQETLALLLEQALTNPGEYIIMQQRLESKHDI